MLAKIVPCPLRGMTSNDACRALKRVCLWADAVVRGFRSSPLVFVYLHSAVCLVALCISVRLLVL